MAGGDNYCPSGLAFQDSVAYHRSRHGGRAEIHLYPVARRYPRGSGSKIFRGKAGVIPDNQPAPAKPGLFQVIGYSLGAYFHIIESEVPGYNPPPAIGAEFNGSNDS